MKFNQLTGLVVLSILASGSVKAAVSADEAKKLGTSLTFVGAEAAGNKEGTIPAYTGGLTTAPAGYKAGGERINPFAAEKPVVVINGGNMAQHADKLTEGTKGLLKKYPDYKVNVFPTHRTAAWGYGKFLADNTVKNALNGKTNADGSTLEGVFGGIPYPIPKTGVEVMWNHLVRPTYTSALIEIQTWTIDTAGKASIASGGSYLKENSFYFPSNAGLPVEQLFQSKARKLNDEPPRSAGTGTLVIDGLNPLTNPRRAWSYFPGQRRVRAAPDVAFDTPVDAASNYDDIQLFNGSLEKYDWKLVGKKEMYVPYSNYELTFKAKPEEALLPKFVNPDLVRFELHRTWVVEASVKSNQRQVYAKRVFYIDEDTWTILATDIYDAAGRLWRNGFAFQTQVYDLGFPFGEAYNVTDLISGAYGMGSWAGGRKNGYNIRVMQPQSAKEWQPDALSGASLR
ncbi:MAG: DUF1329 domain-containing protein [Rhodoferax sp.]